MRCIYYNAEPDKTADKKARRRSLWRRHFFPQLRPKRTVISFGALGGRWGEGGGGKCRWKQCNENGSINTAGWSGWTIKKLLLAQVMSLLVTLMHLPWSLTSTLRSTPPPPRLGRVDPRLQLLRLAVINLESCLVPWTIATLMWCDELSSLLLLASHAHYVWGESSDPFHSNYVGAVVKLVGGCDMLWPLAPAISWDPTEMMSPLCASLIPFKI